MTRGELLEDVASCKEDLADWRKFLAYISRERAVLDAQEALYRGWLEQDAIKLAELKQRLEKEYGIAIDSNK